MTTRRAVFTRLALPLAAIALTTTLTGTAAFAQTFPGKPVRIVTPFPVGAGPDAALRILAEQMSRKWGQPVLVDNRPGGNGFIAIAAFKTGGADPHNLIMMDSNHATTNPHTFSKLPYDVDKDFAPVGMILRTPFFVAVATDSPYKSVEDIIAAAKAKPDGVTYGSWSLGSPGHIGGLRLASQKSATMRHVPYRDFGQLYSAVANKEVDWALASAASGGAMQRSGKIKYLALAAPQRDPLFPNVPATAESAALKGFEVNAWAALFAPRGVANATVDKIAADLREALDHPDTVERYRTIGYEAPRFSPAAFGQLIKAETASWAEVIRAANLKLD